MRKKKYWKSVPKLLSKLWFIKKILIFLQLWSFLFFWSQRSFNNCFIKNVIDIFLLDINFFDNRVNNFTFNWTYLRLCLNKVLICIWRIDDLLDFSFKFIIKMHAESVKFLFRFTTLCFFVDLFLWSADWRFSNKIWLLFLLKFLILFRKLIYFLLRILSFLLLGTQKICT